MATNLRGDDNFDTASPIPAGNFTGKLWLHYNAFTALIVGSGNVSTVTDNGVGDYTANFSNSFSDANYSTPQGSDGPVNGTHCHGYINGVYSSSGVQLSYFNDSNSAARADPTRSCLVVMR